MIKTKPLTLEQRIARLSEYYDSNVLFMVYQYGRNKKYDLPELFTYLQSQVAIDWQILDSYNRELPLISQYIAGYKMWKEERKG
jgi:hypothetical protein